MKTKRTAAGKEYDFVLRTSQLEAELATLKAREAAAAASFKMDIDAIKYLKEKTEDQAARIAELEDKLARAEVIDVSKLSGNTIKFGATVTLIDEDTEEEKAYQIVGESEADVKLGKVSITSPIARALISKKVGDTVEVSTPGGGKSYEITAIAFK